MKPPVVACRSIAAFDRNELASVRRAFDAATPVPLGQAWLPAPQPEFRPAVVRFGFAAEELLVFAEMEDEDVFSEASRLNERTWELGDCVEFFLQAQDAPCYYEFHVTPGNQRLQMQIPIPRPAERRPEEMMLPGELFDSRAWIGAGGWQAFAAIPFSSSGGRPSSFSVSRYDYARGKTEPAHSSTSPHAQLNFHRREEWGALTWP